MNWTLSNRDRNSCSNFLDWVSHQDNTKNQSQEGQRCCARPGLRGDYWLRWTAWLLDVLDCMVIVQWPGLRKTALDSSPAQDLDGARTGCARRGCARADWLCKGWIGYEGWAAAQGVGWLC
ncbi:hypothetical protein Acr_00g0098270 [Actinidia rufa]|uniref:Uncharacterized protein n=1 Tax=Actinidia rufa TaxID=165716 RepID=A0A7J0DZV9_9ERIC|nr:hypothetical protein Acr_00g0098270 [Actinidia rufa]